MADISKGWTLVNSKQKKAEKAKKRKEKAQKEKVLFDEHRKKFEKEMVQQSYSGFVPVDRSEPKKKKNKPKKAYLPQADSTETETMFSAFNEVEQKKMMTKKALKQLEMQSEETKPKKKKKAAKKVSVKSVCETVPLLQLGQYFVNLCQSGIQKYSEHN